MNSDTMNVLARIQSSAQILEMREQGITVPELSQFDRFSDLSIAAHLARDAASLIAEYQDREADA